MSTARERRKQKKVQAFKAELEAFGLPWIEDEDLLKECMIAGTQASTDTWVAMSPSIGEQLKAFFKGIADPSSFLKHLRKMSSGTPEQREAADAAFKAAYLQCFNRSQGTPAAPAPRKQVDIGTVGSKLPKQTIGMMKPTADPEAWKAWVVPAIGLAAAFILWRRS